MSNPYDFFTFIPSQNRQAFLDKTLRAMSSRERKHLINSRINNRTTSDFYYGSGNSALRRQGEDLDSSCGCVVCVVYGGDCANVLRREWIAEEHRKRRGVKTKGQ